MTCQNCGRPMQDTEIFCVGCGHQASQPFIMTWGTGQKVWLVICLVMHTLASIVNLLLFSLSNVLICTTGFLGALCYAFLLSKKMKGAYYGIIALAVIGTIMNFVNGVGLFSITGLLNPVITYLVIRDKWEFMG